MHLTLPFFIQKSRGNYCLTPDTKKLPPKRKCVWVAFLYQMFDTDANQFAIPECSIPCTRNFWQKA